MPPRNRRTVPWGASMKQTRRAWSPTMPLATAAVALWATFAATTSLAEDRYRVEVIVFRNVDVPAEPDEVDAPRRFHDAFELADASPPEVPVRLDKQDGTFANLWTRLDRLADYEPLVRLTFEQSLFDYHPPVRLHDDVVMADELLFPGDVAYLDLDRAGRDGGWFDDYVEPLYRVDGTIQLRRSRFLHIDLDLEYRLEGPAWALAFPAEAPGRLEEGFEWVVAPPSPADEPGDGNAQEITEPFQLHRLRQSRQVRSNTLQYFDSAFLGAIVRVTPIADEGP